MVPELSVQGQDSRGLPHEELHPRLSRGVTERSESRKINSLHGRSTDLLDGIDMFCNMFADRLDKTDLLAYKAND